MNELYKCTVCGVDVDLMYEFRIRGSGRCLQHYNEIHGSRPHAIHESDGLEELWYKTAKDVQTPEQLVEFMRGVMDGYVHDYGTVCKAIAACAVAAAWCANRMEGASGGITGFQAGAVFWEFARAWKLLDGPARLLDYNDMLYPQHESKFQRTIGQSTVEWLRQEAAKKLRDESSASPVVVEHWKQIAAGMIPFGYEVGDG